MTALPMRFGSRNGATDFLPLLWLFLFALAIRWTYALGVYAAMGDSGIISADGHGYMSDARRMVEHLSAGTLQAAQWLGTDRSTMPVFSWLLALNVMAFGDKGAFAYVLTQGVIDAVTCLFVYAMAAMVSGRFALPAGIAAALNPTQIVLSGLVYTDTPFLLFVAIMLFGSLRWLRAPSLGSALIIGIGIGGAALTRILILPWLPVLIVFLLGVVFFRRTFALRHLAHAAVIAALTVSCVVPVISRNVFEHGAFALTSQGGVHLAYWVVPLVKEAKDGTPWERTSEAMSKRVKAKYPDMPKNPFEASRLTAEVGREALGELGYAAIVKAWVTGAVINLAAPAIILSPPVAQLPRTGFYATPGAHIVEKVVNFMFRSDNRIYAWVLLLGVAGVALVRLLQLIGLVAVARVAPAAALLAVLWVSFILAVNGPVASPKYRLPVEPALCLLTGAGFVLLRDWRKRRAKPGAS
ncbi:MAG: ArnT family glycosyltransferase [Pseudorhodoplanes sp.]|uniref:ArnT family glycosyltransferase n=1 Tax=Pseudorhodoplanes sp. TaxID=1934341 RepID=UPI003D14C457